MRKSENIFKFMLLAALILSTLCVPTFALDESEVEAVTGNVLLWFLCAVAFLKVSQKIDSFMAALGVNVGHTGGSMLAEAMIAIRSVSMVMGGGHRGGAGRAGSAGASAAGRSGASGMAGFFKGGLIGMAGRSINNSAVRTATTQTSAVHAAQTERKSIAHTQSTAARHTSGTDSALRAEQIKQRETVIAAGDNTPPMSVDPAGGIQPNSAASQEGAILTGSEMQSDSVLQQESVIQTGGASESHTVNQTRSVENVLRSTHSGFPAHMPTLGGTIFSHSLQSGGQFANDVIGMVARGDMRSTGSITGDLAAQSLQSYMGHTALGASATEEVSYSQVEIGGGRITGREVTPEHPQGIEFAMYHVDQYSRPEGDYQKVFSADGAAWYKQHAVDTVVKTPFRAPDSEIDYQKEIVKWLPTPPKRKDRI